MKAERWKYVFDGLIRKLDMDKERISEPEDRLRVTCQTEVQKEKEKTEH